MYTIDLKNRRIIITDEKTRSQTIINEFDKLERKFLPNTQDTYDCELLLLEVDVYDDNFEVMEKETKAFARRVGNTNWLMEFVEEEYNL